MEGWRGETFARIRDQSVTGKSLMHSNEKRTAHEVGVHYRIYESLMSRVREEVESSSPCKRHQMALCTKTYVRIRAEARFRPRAVHSRKAGTFVCSRKRGMTQGLRSELLAGTERPTDRDCAVIPGRVWVHHVSHSSRAINTWPCY